LTNGRPDRLRAAHLRATMTRIGLDPDRLLHCDAFLEAFSSLPFPYFPYPLPGENASMAADAPDGLVVWLCHRGDKPFFWRDESENICINLPKFRSVSVAAHIYVNFIVQVIEDFHPGSRFVLDLGTVDAFLREERDLETAKLVHQWCGVFNYCLSRTKGQRKLEAYCPFPLMTELPNERFFARPGNVELHALGAILQCPDQLRNVCQVISANWESEAYMYALPESADTFFLDLEVAVRRLITNAGMYATSADGLESSLTEWAHHYLAGITTGSELFIGWVYSLAAYQTRAIAANRGMAISLPPVVKFGDLQGFYQRLAGLNVLVISPFAHACSYAVTSGRIRRIWKQIEVPEFRVVPLRAFVTTYPNRPHASWLETFERTCAEIDVIAERECGFQRRRPPITI
jgi:hypothetical protein